MQIKQAMAADISAKAMLKLAMLNKAAGDNDTYYCDTCGWQGKGSALIDGKCPKCGKAVRLIKSAAADLIPGGRGDNAKPSQFDKSEIAMGMKVEKEHTDSKELAKQIAVDHLTEFPDYYTRLDKMESEAKKAKQAAEAMADAEQGSVNISEEQKQQIIDYIKQTAKLKDEDLHELFAKLNINPHRAEDVIYEFAHELLNDKTAAERLEKLAASMGMMRGLSQKANNLYLNMLKPALARLRAGTISPADFIKQRSRLGLTAEISDIAKPSARAISEGMAKNQALTTALRSQSGDAGKRVFTGGPGSFAGAGYTNPAGRFAPKAAPELNQVQSVGNPLLRKFKYEGLI